MDKNPCVALLMLDLSDAFDVIKHNILIRYMEYVFGITGSALSRIKFYLPGQSAVGSTVSKGNLLHFAVPQASVLGPPQ